jgi:hypothetical protein
MVGVLAVHVGTVNREQHHDHQRYPKPPHDSAPGRSCASMIAKIGSGPAMARGDDAAAIAAPASAGVVSRRTVSAIPGRIVADVTDVQIPLDVARHSEMISPTHSEMMSPALFRDDVAH